VIAPGRLSNRSAGVYSHSGRFTDHDFTEVVSDRKIQQRRIRLEQMLDIDEEQLPVLVSIEDLPACLQQIDRVRRSSRCIAALSAGFESASIIGISSVK
jgi:hypothetical protein